MSTANIYNYHTLIGFDCFQLFWNFLGFNYHTITRHQMSLTAKALNDQGRFKMAAEVGNAGHLPYFDIGEPNTLSFIG